MLKLLLTCVSIVPLALHVPYLCGAWMSSRLDHWDWIFYIMAVGAGIYAQNGEKREKCDPWALIVLAGNLFLAATTNYHHINALGIMASVGVIWSVVWLNYGWKFAYKVLGAFVIMLLGTPSSTYQLSLLFMCSVAVAMGIKFAMMIGCFAWIFANKKFAWVIKKGSLFFVSACMVTLFVLIHTEELYFTGESFVPKFVLHNGEFYGRILEVDENTRRFFASSDAKLYRYNFGDNDISVLAVKCGENIHEIHPASHCLRTSSWRVDMEKIFYLQDDLAVTEIEAQRGETRILVWVWYSSDDFSTPSFLGFRRHFSPNGDYYTFQISTPIFGDVEKSRSVLLKFVQSLKKEGKNE